jgi:hypothetical protein
MSEKPASRRILASLKLPQALSWELYAAFRARLRLS